VDNQKMSKSKGNVVYPEDLLEAGRSAAELRFFLLYGYYRRKGNLTEETLDRAKETLSLLRDRSSALFDAGGGRGSEAAERLIEEITPLFRSEMDNDLHAERAITNVINLLGELMTHRDELSRAQVQRIREALSGIDHVLQVLDVAPTDLTSLLPEAEAIG